jgi:hypothetical protein
MQRDELVADHILSGLEIRWDSNRPAVVVLDEEVGSPIVRPRVVCVFVNLEELHLLRLHPGLVLAHVLDVLSGCHSQYDGLTVRTGPLCEVK